MARQPLSRRYFSRKLLLLLQSTIDRIAFDLRLLIDDLELFGGSGLFIGAVERGKRWVKRLHIFGQDFWLVAGWIDGHEDHLNLAASAGFILPSASFNVVIVVGQ